MLLCLSYPRPSWELNHAKVTAVFTNLVGVGASFHSTDICELSPACSVCYCGARYTAAYLTLVKECPACYKENKVPKYFADYLLGELKARKMHPLVADSYLAAAIAFLVENENVCRTSG